MSDEQQTPGSKPVPQTRKGWPKGKPRGPRHLGDTTPGRALGEVDLPMPPPKPAAKSAIQVTKRRNDALARRLSGNPHSTGLRHIPLKEPKRWQLYIANNYNNDDELYRMRHEMGWEPLEPADLACKPEEIGFRVSEDGNLVRGPQGKEMIFKMAIDDYNALQQRKTEANNVTIGKPSATKTAVTNAVASVHGDEAASFVDQHFVGEVKDTLEPMPQ